MCGIAGIFEYGRNEPGLSEDILNKMTTVITHRGPDSGGRWISGDGRCGFGFRRLAIIDLSPAGNQPMTTPDGRFTIVFNGEIYNHDTIRKGLVEKGYRYKSKTDTETILYGFMEYGKDIIEKLHGMWGLAIWDDYEKELFLSRDRVGIKPLYFSNRDGRLIFASEIKSILQHPDVSAEFNINELPNYLNFGMSSNRESLFKGIYKIPAAHCLTIKLNGDIHLKNYWQPLQKDTEYSKLSETEIQSEILRLLRQSIKDRMMSDVPFGVFLSGGVDSSLNVALMHELMDRPIDTFTVGFKELEKYNELEYANKISSLYGTNHHEILIDDKDALPALDDLAWHADEPNADPVCLPLYFLSKLTKQSGTTVVQVGEGSDEQYVGYSWMLREYNFYKSYWKFYTSLPGIMKKTAYQLSKPLQYLADQPIISEYLRRGTNGEELYWSGLPVFPATEQFGLINDGQSYNNDGQPYNFDTPANYAKAMHSNILNYRPDADYLQRMLYTELQQRLPEMLLMRVDKMGMAHSIEARVPFLDHRLLEFSMSIPPEIKTPDKTTTKYILKKAVEGILPDEIIYRKKMGFAAPVSEWIRGVWYDFAEDIVLNKGVSKTGIFNKDYTKSLLNKHKSGQRNKSKELFSLMTLNLWHEKFFGGKD